MALPKPRTPPRDAESTKPVMQKPMTKKGGSAATGHLPKHARCPGAAGYGGESCHTAPQLQIPAACPTPTSAASLANPSPWGDASRAAELARNRSRLLNARGQVAADRIPRGPQRDCRCCAAALPRKSFPSNVQLLRASFTFSVHQGVSRLFPASTCGGEKGALELYPVLTWWPPGPHLTTSSLSATRSILPYQAKLSLQLVKEKRRD